jgi:hypothetical protein
MKIKKVRYFGFDDEKVNKMFTGGLTHCNDFAIKGVSDWVPVAVYKVANPDRSKKHKDYLILNKEYVSGLDEKDIQKYRYQLGILCLSCDTALYSIHRHHYHSCGCPNQSFVDGGRDYLRSGGASLEKIKNVYIDLLNNKIVDNIPE